MYTFYSGSEAVNNLNMIQMHYLWKSIAFFNFGPFHTDTAQHYRCNKVTRVTLYARCAFLDYFPVVPLLLSVSSQQPLNLKAAGHTHNMSDKPSQPCPVILRIPLGYDLCWLYDNECSLQSSTFIRTSNRGATVPSLNRLHNFPTTGVYMSVPLIVMSCPLNSLGSIALLT